MRVLFASTQGAGHFNALVPFANAVREVLDDRSHRDIAQSLAGEPRGQPPVDRAVALFEPSARS